MLRQLLQIPLTPEKVRSISELKLTETQQVLVDQIIAGTFNVPTPPEIKGHTNFYQNYQKLYPYLALAHSFENNGIIEDHTKKLAIIFDKAEEALKYLRDFHDKNQDKRQFVHDACLFQLPTLESQNFVIWKKLAKTILLNDQYRKLLSLSPMIDAQIAKDQKEREQLELKIYNRRNVVKVEKPPLTQEQVTTLKEQIDKEIKEKNKFCRQFAAHHDVMRADEKNVEKNFHYLSELGSLYNDRAVLHLRKSIHRYSADDFQDVYKRILTLTDPAKQIFIKNGIDQKYYNQFMSLDRSKAGKNIPDIGILDCGNGFYMKKLDVYKQDEGGIAACLGKLTNCCQSLSGEAGEPCALHGLTHPDSGFYVLFKGDAKGPKITDTIFGQTWVNRTESGALLFDSIESTQGKSDRKQYLGLHARKTDGENCNTVKQAFRLLASHLVKQHNVLSVNGGFSLSGISDRVVIESKYQFIHESPKDYTEYRDSEVSGLLADRRLLGTFNENNLFVLDVKAVESDLKQTPHLSENIRFTISFLLQNKLLVDEHLESIPQYFKQKVISYSDTQKAFLKILQDFHEDPKGKDQLLKFMQENPSVDINLRSDHGDSALTLLAEEDSPETIKGLLAAKALVNLQDLWGNTALMKSVGNKCNENVKVLCEAKATVNMKNEVDNKTALMVAAQKGPTDIFKILCDAKAEINVRDKDNITPLMIAAEKGHADIVRLLCDAKADLNVQEKRNKDTALMIAAKQKSVEVIQLLLEAKADINAENDSNETPLMKSVQEGHVECIQVLLEAKANINAKDWTGETVLMKLGPHRQKEVFEMLVMAKADIDATNISKKTLLFYAAKKGLLEIVQILCDKKADLNGIASSPTPLMAAIEAKKTAVVKMLCEAKANLDIQDDKQDTALIRAVKSKQPQMVKILCEAKASLDIENEEMSTALIEAAVLFQDDCTKLPIEIIKTLCEAKAAVNIQDEAKYSALYYAARYDKIDAVKMLLAAKAEVSPQSFEVTKLALAKVGIDIDHCGVMTLNYSSDFKRNGLFSSIQSQENPTQENSLDRSPFKIG